MKRQTEANWIYNQTCMLSGDHTELPVCSICLERMDESISTLLTILCNHSFHGNCLAQWEDTTCPVCRYVQSPEVVAEQRCSGMVVDTGIFDLRGLLVVTCGEDKLTNNID